MANTDEDVIELGSSDEEREPAPKKKKPLANVMVHLPSKLPGVTIKPATTIKPKINPVSIAKNNIGKAVTVTKVSSNSKLANPFANKNLMNGNIIVKKQPVQRPQPAAPSIHPSLRVTPTIKKLRAVPPGKIPIKIARAMSNTNLIQALPLSTLPPGITVKRASQMQPVLKGNIKPNPVNRQVNRPVNRQVRQASNTPHKKTVFVDLDDDDTTPSPVGPQWYLRPEEQDKKAEKPEEKSSDGEEQTGSNEEEATTEAVKETDLEEQNNAEPKAPEYIEITIEDSPAKLKPSKRTCEVLEQAITIDDSPGKVVPDKQASQSGSDEETTVSKEKYSKKKLEYPKTFEPETMEIEIQLTPVDDNLPNDDKTDSQDDVTEKEIVEILDSPLKPAESILTSTPKKKPIHKPISQMSNNILVTVPRPKLRVDEIRSVNVPKPQLKLNIDVTTPGEFHPVYQSFIDLCFRLENSDDMIKIVDKKIKSYYRQVPKEYTESETFTDMVASKINAMKASPEKMYLYIKDVVDELNLQRKIAKAQPVVVTVNEEQEKLLYGEDSEFDSKRQRQIRKLEKTLKKLHRAIQKLEEQEVDFDDEEDSVYLLTESDEATSKDNNQPIEKSELLKRYKERMIRVHAKFCQLTNTKMPSEPRVIIDARLGQHKGPAKRLEKWINKKVPIGTPLPFPDFHDVLRCVREANQEDTLGWNEADIMEEARDLFTRCGKKLQRRRQENEWRLAASRIQSEIDPAEESDVLKKALEDNRRVASKKETEVFNKFADRQNMLNLEAVEIGDKEADESPVETDDEEPTEESSSLETKEKRKERLKRLLQETSKKDTDDKEKSDVDDKEKSDVESESNNKNAKETDSQVKEVIGESQMETETLSDNQNDVEKDPLADKQNDIDKVHTLSEDSSKIDSDIDELHLLQKLHSNVVDSSTLESSDSESAIAISDTLSSGDNRKQASDVISIENSSYSESEKNEQEFETVNYSQNKITTESVNVQVEIECSDAGVERIIKKSNNDEYNESVEDILLASSDDEASKDIKSKADVEQSKDKNTNSETEENLDNTDAISMESIEIKDSQNVIENSEVTSIASTEAADDMSPHTVEVSSMDSVEVVEGESNPIEEISQTSTIEPNKDTDSKSPENDKSSDEVNNIKSGADQQNITEDDDKNTEITQAESRKLTESEDNVPDKPEQETSEINTNGDNVCDNTEDITAANDKESVEEVSNNLPAVPEPMEVDDPKT